MSGPITSVLLVVAVLATSCGDDGVNHLPDAPLAPGVTLSVAPGTVVLGAGASTTVTATIERHGGFSGEVVVTATSASIDVTVSGGTIPGDATSIPLTVMAGATAASAIRDVSITATSTGVDIEPAMLAVTIAGRVGSAIGGEAGGDQAGSAVALSANGSRVIIGSPVNDGTGADAGHARVFERNAGAWVQVGADIDAEAAGDRYGTAVSISDDGSRVAVGSYYNTGTGNASGHVRVFDLVGGAWTQVGADIDGLASSHGHGWTLALSASGSRVAVGAPSHNNATGRVLLHELVGGTWTQRGATIIGGHELGHAVDISGDGNRIAVSSPNPSGDSFPGQVDVYEWNGAALIAVGAAIVGLQPSAGCGESVALSMDGNTLAIGCNKTDNGGTNTGSVHVYRWTTAWTQVGAAVDGPPGNEIGTSISLSADGTRVLAGGPAGGGVAVLYTLVQNTWTLEGGPDFGSGARTGHAVALSPDGKTAAIGVPYADSPGNISGEVRLYDLP